MSVGVERTISIDHLANETKQYRQGGYVFAWVCLWLCEFVRVFVCEQDNSKTYGHILMKFSEYV